MNPSQGLITSLNAIREMSIQGGTAYHQYVPIVGENTDIGSFGTPILNNTPVMNEFMSMLVNRIVYTSFENRYTFKNPLQMLEGDKIPLGYAGQEIFINPAKGRKYNVNDFAGLLAKYEADVKVQYTAVNMDLQYPVTVSRHKLKQAFVSWDSLDSFIMELSNSLYNGAYIGEYRYTIGLISGAYKSNQVQTKLLTEPTTEALAKEFSVAVRTMFLNMQAPSSEYNAWKKVGGYGNDIITYSNPEDIVLVIRNDVRSYIDVMSLANAFNIDRADLLGRIISVDSFDQFDDEGNKIFDGSNIIGFIGDKSWFRVKRQDMYLDEFYNPNNRTWQYYLNLTKMYNYSLFANGVVLCSEEPEVAITSLSFNAPEGITIQEVGDTEGLDITVNPETANTPTITYETEDDKVFTVVADENNDRHCTITATGEGTATLTATAGNVTATVEVTVESVSA